MGHMVHNSETIFSVFAFVQTSICVFLVEPLMGHISDMSCGV